MREQRRCRIRWAVVIWGMLGLLWSGSGIAHDLDLWIQLIETPAPSGMERDLQNLIRTALGSIPVQSDALGNLFVTFGTGGEHWLVCTHVDEPAWVVGETRDDGYLRITPTAYHHLPARWQWWIVGQPVWIGPPWRPGVVAIPSTHLQRGVPGRRLHYNDLDMNRLYVDVGAATRHELAQANIGVLSRVVLDRTPVRLAHGYLAGWTVADRAHVEILIHLARRLHAHPPATGRVTIAWMVQELYGAKGRQRLLTDASYDRVIWLEVVAPDRACCDDTMRVPIRPGSAIPVAAWTPAEQNRTVNAIWTAAQAAGVDIVKVPSWDTPPMVYAPRRDLWRDAHVALLSLPVRYPMTLVETVAVADRDRLLRVLAGLFGVSETDVQPMAPVRRVAIGPAATSDRIPAEQWLRVLVETYGVSGHEDPVAARIRQWLPDWARPETDAMGNLWVTVGPKDAPHWVFVAHMDEIGYEIDHILADGTATVRKRGGFYDEIFEAHPVVVVGTDGRLIPAIVRPRPQYWDPERARADFRDRDIRVEFGTHDADATIALGVQPGLAMTFRKQYRPLLGMRASGRSFDDRVGSTALVAAIRRIRPERCRKRITFLWSVQEEIGLYGARAFAETHPDVAVVVPVDTFVSADSPLEPYPYGRAMLGRGAVLRAIDSSNMAPWPVVQFVRNAARTADRPLQWGITRGGNDGAAFVPYGALDFPIGWPLRYSHTNVEVIDLRDLESLIEWVVWLATHEVPIE